MLHGNCAAARLDPRGRDVLLDRNPSVRVYRAGPGSGRRCGPHRGRQHLYVAGAGGRPAGQGTRDRAGRADPPAGRGRDHARTPVRQRHPPAALPARPPGHPAPAAARLPAAGPRAAALVRPGHGRHRAGLGHHRRPGGAARRGRAARPGLRRPRPLGRPASPQVPGLPVVRAVPGRGECPVVRRGHARRAADQRPARIPGHPGDVGDAGAATHPSASRRGGVRGNPQHLRRRLLPYLAEFSVRARPGRPAGGRRGRPRRGAPGRRGPGGVGLLPRVPVFLRPRRPGLPRPGHGDRRQRGGLLGQHRGLRAVRHPGDPGRAALRRGPGGAHGPRSSWPGCRGG